MAYGSRGIREATIRKIQPLIEGIDQMSDGDVLDFVDFPNPFTARYRLYKFLHIKGQTPYYQIQIIDEPGQPVVIRVFKLRSELTKLQTIKYTSSSKEPFIKKGFTEEDVAGLERRLEKYLYDWPENRPLYYRSYAEAVELLLPLVKSGEISEDDMKEILLEHTRKTTKKKVPEAVSEEMEREALRLKEKFRLKDLAMKGE